MANYQYQIVMEDKNPDGTTKQTILFTESTKRKITSDFNRFFRICKNSESHTAYLRNAGWFEGTYFGEWNSYDYEVFIRRTAI